MSTSGEGNFLMSCPMSERPVRLISVDVNSDQVIAAIVGRLDAVYPGHLGRNRKLANSILCAIRELVESDEPDRD